MTVGTIEIERFIRTGVSGHHDIEARDGTAFFTRFDPFVLICRTHKLTYLACFRVGQKRYTNWDC